MIRYIQSWRAIPRSQLWMLIVLGVAVLLANVRQPFPAEAPLQHIPTVILLIAAPPLLQRWPLSDRSIAAFILFLLLHTLGGRYTYSNVPYDRWSVLLTGHDITGPFGSGRNQYDRLVHLAFGLLFVGPIGEIGRRHAGLGARAALSTAWLFLGAVSALYEIFEWLLTILVAPGMADQYNGQQGDAWDSQKDMAFAICGASVAIFWRVLRPATAKCYSARRDLHAMTDIMTGGCQCGAVRFAAQIHDEDAYLCHCRMCQRAAGNVSVAFKTVLKADVAWTGEPAWYASSAIAKRPFCAACGTPLGFAYNDSENMDLNVGAFDEPKRFVPRSHFGIETRLDHWLDAGGLPGYRLEDHPATVDRWMKAIGKLPD